MSAIKNLKLFYYPASRSARVRWALHETVGDNFELEKVELYEGAQYRESYRAMNPNHCVPLLEITWADGRVQRMIESAAIDAHAEKGLSPPAHELSAERADYLQMLHFGGTWMDMALWQIRVHEHILPTEQRDTRTLARYRKKFVDEIEPQLKGRLERTPYICGEHFSGADIIVGHNVTWARGYKLCADELFRSYLSRVSKRPAFQKAFSDLQEFRLAPPENNQITAQFTG
jgi:glutathione S-transferase